MAFTCPRCGRTSHHPDDERQGYCGACRDFTGSGDVYECGARSIVPPAHAGAVWCPCGSPEPMHAFREPRVPGPAVFAALAENPEAPWVCAAAGRTQVDLDAVARYVARRYRVPFITSPHTDSGSPSREATDSVAERDDRHWGDAMQWSPGHVEW